MIRLVHVAHWRPIGRSLFRFGLTATVGILLSGCDKTPLPAHQEPPKSLAYYNGHPKEAVQTAWDCKHLEENELSTLSPQQHEVWRQTTQGINCANASNAAMVIMNNEYEQRMKNAADNFDANLPKKTKR